MITFLKELDAALNGLLEFDNGYNMDKCQIIRLRQDCAAMRSYLDESGACYESYNFFSNAEFHLGLAASIHGDEYLSKNMDAIVHLCNECSRILGGLETDHLPSDK